MFRLAFHDSFFKWAMPSIGRFSVWILMDGVRLTDNGGVDRPVTSGVVGRDFGAGGSVSLDLM